MSEVKVKASMPRSTQGSILMENIKLKEEIESLRAQLAELSETEDELFWALRRLHSVVKSGGVDNLARGVELGAMSWAMKAHDAMQCAEQALTAAEQSK